MYARKRPLPLCVLYRYSVPIPCSGKEAGILVQTISTYLRGLEEVIRAQDPHKIFAIPSWKHEIEICAEILATACFRQWTTIITTTITCCRRQLLLPLPRHHRSLGPFPWPPYSPHNKGKYSTVGVMKFAPSPKKCSKVSPIFNAGIECQLFMLVTLFLLQKRPCLHARSFYSQSIRVGHRRRP
jgi:hypothetical protein